jgi:SAM-dependent methyltransferase
VVDAPEVTRALSFGRGAAEYDRVRPEYSPEALELVAERLGLGPGAEVLDLAAGTGKLTRPLIERFGRVTAVEPDPGMRAVLGRSTDRCKVVEGRAEAIPLEDGSVDAVFVGQAFHWFDKPRALAEMARVLRPRGGVALLWNSWWETDSPLPEAARALREDVRGRARRGPEQPHTKEPDRSAFFQSAGFEAVRVEEVPVRDLEIDGADLVTLYFSTSPFGILPPKERDSVETELRRLISGSYRLPVVTELEWTRRA